MSLDFLLHCNNIKKHRRWANRNCCWWPLPSIRGKLIPQLHCNSPILVLCISSFDSSNPQILTWTSIADPCWVFEIFCCFSIICFVPFKVKLPLFNLCMWTGRCWVMHSLGVNSYSFSTSWSRVLPSRCLTRYFSPSLLVYAVYH